MSFKNSIILLLCLSVLVSLFSCGGIEDGKDKVKSKTYYKYFDTVCTVFSYLGDGDTAFAERCAEAESMLSYYHKLFDIYYEYDGVNNIRTINRAAGKNPVKVDRELIDFLLFALDMYTLTDGEVNIAMGSVLKLWHSARETSIDHPDEAYIPAFDDLCEAALHTDLECLVIDEANSTVYISDPYMSLDVGALAKGYATDKVAEKLISMGASSYVLNFGGNIRTIGEKPDGEGWLTGITNPDKSSSESLITKITLKDVSCVTSGNYERYYVYSGEKYHHIIDKDTLMPSRYFSSVTVLHKSSAIADALSTALFSMSYEDGKALADSLGAKIIWITEDFEMINEVS